MTFHEQRINSYHFFINYQKSTYRSLFTLYPAFISARIDHYSHSHTLFFVSLYANTTKWYPEKKCKKINSRVVLNYVNHNTSISPQTPEWFPPFWVIQGTLSTEVTDSFRRIDISRFYMINWHVTLITYTSTWWEKHDLNAKVFFRVVVAFNSSWKPTTEFLFGNAICTGACVLSLSMDLISSYFTIY